MPADGQFFMAGFDAAGLVAAGLHGDHISTNRPDLQRGGDPGEHVRAGHHAV